MASNRPKMTVEVDFVNDPTSVTETWTDITAYCRTKSSNATLLSTSRGREYELSKPATGTFSLVLNNTDGRFDPDNFLSPYVTGSANPGGAAGLILPQRRLRIRATWLGITYNVFRGVVDEWPQEWTDAGVFGVSNTSGFDALAALSSVSIGAFPIVEALKDSPTGLYRCNDPSGSVSAGNSSSVNQPLSAIRASSGAQVADDFAFASDSGDGRLAADPTNSLQFTSVTGTAFQWTAGYYLRLAELGVGAYATLGGCSLELWFKSSDTSAANQSGDIMYQYDVNGARQIEMYLSSIGATSAGVAVAFVNAAGTVLAQTISPTINVLDGAWHHLVATLASDNRTASLYVDGVLDGTQVVPGSAVTWNTTSGLQVNSNTTPQRLAGAFFTNCNVKNIGVYSTALSGARVLAHAQAGRSFEGEACGTRVGRILDAAAWPTGMRGTIDAGDSLVGLQVTDGQKVTVLLEQVLDTEQGDLFIGGDGKVNFRARSTRYNHASAATFGENPGEFHYAEGGLQVQKDPKDVYNDITVSREGGSTVRNQSPASQLRYFPRTLSVASIAVDDAAVVYLAEFLLDRYDDPVTRIPKLVLEPTSDVSLWPQVLGREIGDCITVTRRPNGASRPISADVFIEKISHAVTGQTWTTTWQLSPASAWAVFELDSATYGRLDGGSTLNASMTSGQTTLVTPDAVFNASDVPYVVLVDQERMTVTAATTPGTAPQTLTVTRGTTGTAAVAHNAGAAVTLLGSYGLAL